MNRTVFVCVLFTTYNGINKVAYTKLPSVKPSIVRCKHFKDILIEEKNSSKNKISVVMYDNSHNCTLDIASEYDVSYLSQLSLGNQFDESQNNLVKNYNLKALLASNAIKSKDNNCLGLFQKRTQECYELTRLVKLIIKNRGLIDPVARDKILYIKNASFLDIPVKDTCISAYELWYKDFEGSGCFSEDEATEAHFLEWVRIMLERRE